MKIALSQLNFKLGDFEQNYNKILAAVNQHTNKADLIVFSELALSGYYPKDLIERSGFVNKQNTYLERLITYSKNIEIGIILGVIRPAPNQAKPFYNSLCLIHKGKILYQYHKMLLPVYNIFDEARHFTPGEEVGYFDFKNTKIGFLICEDGWRASSDSFATIDPVKLLKEKKPDVTIAINGSPSNVGKQEERIKQFSRVAQNLSTPLLFCNQIGGHDDLIFDGASFCLNLTGDVVGSLNNFTEDSGIIDLNSKQLSVLSGFKQYSPLSNVDLFYQQAIVGLRDYVTKCGFKTVVLGVSGGIDSAVTCALATIALGQEHITAISMPTRFSSEHSIHDAAALCKNLNIKHLLVSIEEEFKLACERFKHCFKEVPASLTEQNIQARIRGRVLMEYSNQTGALVLATGNKSELSVGYTTLYGDMTGGFNLIGDLYKTEVYLLAQYINHQHNGIIPSHTLTKAPSAELTHNQKDSDSLPPYEILDPILKLYLEGDLLPESEQLALLQQLNHISPEFIEKIHKTVDLAEFKRKQAPPIIRMQRRAFGIGRQFPIAATY